MDPYPFAHSEKVPPKKYDSATSGHFLGFKKALCYNKQLSHSFDLVRTAVKSHSTVILWYTPDDKLSTYFYTCKLSLSYLRKPSTIKYMTSYNRMIFTIKINTGSEKDILQNTQALNWLIDVSLKWTMVIFH